MARFPVVPIDKKLELRRKRVSGQHDALSRSRTRLHLSSLTSRVHLINRTGGSSVLDLRLGV